MIDFLADSSVRMESDDPRKWVNMLKGREEKKIRMGQIATEARITENCE